MERTDCFLEAPAPALAPAPGGDVSATRTFTGLAYSGEAVSDGWMPVVIDLASMHLPPPNDCPVLLSHERDQSLGYATLALTDNAPANQVASDADEGFPWQLSVHAQASRSDEIAPGASVQVNGRTLLPRRIRRDLIEASRGRAYRGKTLRVTHGLRVSRRRAWGGRPAGERATLHLVGGCLGTRP